MTTKTAAPSLADFAEAAELSDEPITTTRTRTSKFAVNPLRGLVSQSQDTGKTVTMKPMPGSLVSEALGYIRAAAKELDRGVKFAIPKDYAEQDSVTVRFQVTDKKAYSPRVQNGKAECPVCNVESSVTSDGLIRVHGPRDNRCKGSGTAVS